MKLNTRPRPRVLCVDDNEDFREMLSILLKFLRIEVRGVATAAQALWLMQAERFDLYLLDAWLPEVDGFELCRQIRRADPRTPILFFTGAAYDADKEKGAEAGANAYVVKPDVDGLLESIAKFIAPVAARPTTHWTSSEQTSVLWAESAERSGAIRLDSFAVPLSTRASR